MTFAVACREADRKQRREPKDRRIEELQRLMADDVSLDRAWSELNKRSTRIATLHAAKFLMQVGDPKRWRRWFDSHSAQERAAILRHLETRRRQGK